MSKCATLWDSGTENLPLAFTQIEAIAGVPIDHSFLRYKNELLDYGYYVEKISTKAQTVRFHRVEEHA